MTSNKLSKQEIDFRDNQYMWMTTHKDDISIAVYAVHPTRKMAIDWLLGYHGRFQKIPKWRQWYSRGWRCVKVKVIHHEETKEKLNWNF